jgi:hypothetical protein
LNRRQRPAEGVEIAIGQRRQQRHQDQVRHVFDLAIRRRRQRRECFRLVGAADRRGPPRHGDDAAPSRRKRQPGDQRTDAVAIGASAAFDDETAAGERPRANRRSLRAAHGHRQPRRRGRNAVQFGERPADCERELRTRPEAGVCRERTMHDHPRAAVEMVVREKRVRECRSAIRMLARDAHRR